MMEWYWIILIGLGAMLYGAVTVYLFLQDLMLGDLAELGIVQRPIELHWCIILARMVADRDAVGSIRHSPKPLSKNISIMLN